MIWIAIVAGAVAVVALAFALAELELRRSVRERRRERQPQIDELHRALERFDADEERFAAQRAVERERVLRAIRQR